MIGILFTIAFAEDISLVVDMARLPPTEVLEANYQIARRYVEKLEERRAIVGGWNGDLIDEEIAHANAHTQHAYCLAYVVYPRASWRTRRQYRDEAKALLGEYAWNVGLWPNPLPP